MHVIRPLAELERHPIIGNYVVHVAHPDVIDRVIHHILVARPQAASGQDMAPDSADPGKDLASDQERIQHVDSAV